MENQFSVGEYQITTDPQFQNKRYGVTPELEKQFEKLHHRVKDKNDKKIIDKLNQLIAEYPSIPVLKNYLSVAYNAKKDYQKVFEINHWILTEHPDYLFGIINQANKFIEDNEFDKVPEILGETMEIKALFPDRDVFHLTEITSFYKTVIRYYTAINNEELADNMLEILREIAPDHRDTEQAEIYLYEMRMENAATKINEEDTQKITTTVVKIIPVSQKTSAPKFNHPEIKNLYSFGMSIPDEKLKEIIALPHDSLVEDLEKILLDAVERFDYFNGLEWEEETHSAALHAILLLKEINAVESLPSILSFLKYDNDFLELWLDDHTSSTLWQCFYSLGFNNTALLKEFLLLPGVKTQCKTAVTEAFCQMLLHHPEKRDEILAIYSEVFTAFSEASLQDNLIDSEFLELMICDAVECNFVELLPIIKVLYSKSYVFFGLNGEFNDVEESFSESVITKYKEEVFTIFQIYHDVSNIWEGYQERDEIVRFNTLQQVISDKVERNDPCTCGSGKKYKKCCMEV